MIVKGYWELNYSNANGCNKGKRIFKAKNARKAIQKFYKCDNCWYQRHDFYVVSVEPHSVKEIVNGNE